MQSVSSTSALVRARRASDSAPNSVPFTEEQGRETTGDPVAKDHVAERIAGGCWYQGRDDGGHAREEEDHARGSALDASVRKKRLAFLSRFVGYITDMRNPDSGNTKTRQRDAVESPWNAKHARMCGTKNISTSSPAHLSEHPCPQLGTPTARSRKKTQRLYAGERCGVAGVAREQVSASDTIAASTAT